MPVKSTKQMLEQVLALPEGTEVEIRAPVVKFYGEDYAYLFDDVRTKGYRRAYIDGNLEDTSQELELDEDETYQIDVLVDRIVVRPEMDKQILASLEHGLLLGEGFISLHVVGEPAAVTARAARYGGKKTLSVERFYNDFACPEHGVVMGEVEAHYYSFNLPSGSSSCVTCMGLGTYRQVHPDLLVVDQQ